MKKLLPLLCTVCLAIVNGADFHLAENGKANYVIAKPVEAHAVEEQAATELAEYLGKVTGIRFDVVTEDVVPSGRKAVYVGQTKFAGSRDIDWSGFGQDEWLIRSFEDGALVLGGGKYCGIYYAVVDYLERQAGVRWLDERCEVVPVNKDLEVGTWNLRRKPSFKIRQVFDLLDWEPKSGKFKERNKGFSYTQEMTGVSKYFGGKRPYHTYGEYAEDWPRDKAELYSRDAEGKPLVPEFGGEGVGQICVSNPEVRQRVIAKMKLLIEQDRKAAAEKKCAPPLIYDVSPNDNNNKCTCAGCMALAEKEGTYSGATIDFINEVAREIGKEYPEILIKTFAYMYCQEPPKYIHAEPNVMIQIALMGTEFGGTYNKYDTMRALSNPVNADAYKMFSGWGEHAHHLMHWEYWTFYPVIPEPTVRVNAFIEDLKTDKECHVEAFFAEYENPAFNGFSALLRYLTFKMLDDDSREPQAVIDEFMSGYYEEGATQMRALLDYMEKRQAECQGPLGYLDVNWRPFHDDDYFKTVFALLDSAEASVASKPDVVARIRRERVCLLSALLSRWPYLKDRSAYNAPALIEEFRTEANKALDYFFDADTQNFRESQRINATVDNFCIAFKGDTAEGIESLPAELNIPEGAEVLSLNAARYLYEAKAKLVDDPEAFCGKTSRYEYGEDNLDLIVNNWMEGVRLATKQLTDDVLPRDGKYHWLDLGVIPITNNGRSHALVPSHCQGIRCEFYRRIQEGTVWHMYMSLKCDDKAICSDRIILVLVEK